MQGSFDLQNNNVLPRQHLDHLVEHDLASSSYFGHAHLVHFEDQYFRIFLAELEDRSKPPS